MCIIGIMRSKGWVTGFVVALGLWASAAGAVEFGGYFDAQGNFNTAASEGFVLRAGGVTARQRIGSVEGYLDFGLKNGVALDTLKSQAYVQVEGGFFGFRLGQFDSPFRYNPVDSSDRLLVSESLTDSATGMQLYTKLTGARATLNLGPATVHAIVANPRNQPILGAGGVLDLGAQVLVDLVLLKVGTGILYSPDAALGWIWTSNVGLNLGLIGVDAGFVYKNSTSTTAWSLILEPLLHFSDGFAWSVRGEYLKPTAATVTAQVSTGPQFKIEKMFRLKAEYSVMSGTTTALNHGLGLAALVVF